MSEIIYALKSESHWTLANVPEVIKKEGFGLYRLISPNDSRNIQQIGWERTASMLGKFLGREIVYRNDGMISDVAVSFRKPAEIPNIETGNKGEYVYFYREMTLEKQGLFVSGLEETLKKLKMKEE